MNDFENNQVETAEITESAFEKQRREIKESRVSKQEQFRRRSASQNFAMNSFASHFTDLSRIDYDTLNDTQKEAYEQLQSLNRHSEAYNLSLRKHELSEGFGKLMATKTQELSDGEINAGIMMWANLTGLYEDKSVDDIAKAWNISNKRKLWEDKLRPSIESILTEPRTALEITMMTEEERRKEFDAYWRKKNHYAEKMFENALTLVAPSMGTSGYAGGAMYYRNNPVPKLEPEIPEATEADYESWVNEKTFGLQRIQLEGALLSTEDPEKARLAWIIALSDMSNEEKAELIEASTKDLAERREIAQAAYWMNPELDYGFWGQMLFKSGDALADFGSNVWNFTTDSIPEMGRDVLVKAGLATDSPISVYEQIEEAGGLDKYFDKHEIRAGSEMWNIEQIYEIGKAQKSSKEVLRILEKSDIARYKSLGFTQDAVTDGVAVVARMTPIFAAHAIPGVGSAVSEYLLIADMSYALSEDMAELGFTEREARWYGVIGGAVMGRIEHMQIRGIESVDNAFLKLARTFAGRKLVMAAAKKSVQKAFQTRAKVTATELLEETLQNLVEELTIQAAQHIEGKDLKSMEASISDFVEKTGDMIAPVIVSTNLGGGFRSGLGVARDIATTAKADRNGTLGILSLNGKRFAEMFNEARQNTNFDAKDYAAYTRAETEAERNAILAKPEYRKNKDKVKSVWDTLKQEETELFEFAVNKAAAEIGYVDNALSGDAIAGIRQNLEQTRPAERSPEFRAEAEAIIKGYVDAYGGSENVVFVNSVSELSPEVQAQINAKLAEQGKSLETFIGIDGFNIGDKTYLIGDAMTSPNDALRILKHERSHWGLNEVRDSEKAHAFFENIVDLYGGEAVVREALKKVGGNFYANENRYEVAEEFLSRIAEKVAGKHELDAKEKGIFEQAKSFMIDTFSYIPENASDEYIANQIRLIWDKNFGIESTGENFFDDNATVRFRAGDENASIAQAEYEEVKSKYQNTEQWLKAPNGKPTDLNEKQWIQVRTPSFKKWFGDWETDPQNASKVVDENGEPKIVYHGTDKGGFTEFKTDGEGKTLNTGAWFSDNRRMSETYAKRDDDFNLSATFEDLVDRGFIETKYAIKDTDGLVDENTVREDKESIERDYDLNEGDTIVEFYELFAANGYSLAESAIKEEIVKEANNNIEEINEENSGIYSCFLNIRTPETYDAEGANWDEITTGYFVVDSEGDFVEGFATKEEANDYVNSHTEDSLEVRAETQTTDEIVRDARYGEWADGVIIKNVSDEGGYGRGYNDGTNYVVFNPAQIKSSNDNTGEFNSANSDIRFRVAKGAENLVVLHNISASKLIHAQRLGGLPVPSLAVSRVEYPLENFGEISLIAPKGILKERAARTFNADVYSPRQPRGEIAVSNKERNRIAKVLSERAKKHGLEGLYFDIDFEKDSLKSSLANDSDVRKLYEKETGESGAEYWKFHDGEWLSNLIDHLNIEYKERIFIDYTQDGNRKYIPYTLENIARIMKKELRGGENFNYGVAYTRAHVAKEFKSLKEIQAHRDDILPAYKMEPIKKQMQDEFLDLLSDATKYLKWGSDGFGAIDQVSDNIVEAIESGNWESMKASYFKDDFDYTALKKFVEALADVPTEYFETKLQRIMRLNEFSGAVIPESANEQTRKVLDENGIKYKEYKSDDERAKVFDEFTAELNKETGDIRFRVSQPLNDADIGKFFNEVRQKIPYSDSIPPEVITEKRDFEIEAKSVADFLEKYRRVKAADGMFVNLRSLEHPRPVRGEQQAPTLLERARHLIGTENIKGEIHRELDYAKLAWVYNIPETLHTAQAVFLNEWGSRKVRAYVKNYGGTLHIVLVNQKGETLGHLITQFPQKQNERHAHLRDARLSWFTPNTSPNYSAQQAHPSSFEQGRTSNLENRTSSSDEGTESQGKFSVRSDSQKRATQLAAVFAPEIFKADGEITQAIRDEARRLAPNFTDAELNAALEDAQQIAAALSLEFDSKAASIPDKRVIDLTKEYMKSKRIQSARKTVEDAMRMASRGERLRQKLESDEEDSVRKMAEGVKGFTTDELALRRIDLADAVYTIIETEEGDVFADTGKINSELQKIAKYVKKWTDDNNADYEVYLAQLKRTLANAFEDIVDELVYGKNVKSAMGAVYRILNSQSEKNVMAQSERLAERLAEYFQKETKDFAEKDIKAKVKKSKEKAAKEEQRLEKARIRALKAVKNLANKQKLPEHNKLATARKLPAKTQAFLAQIKKVISLSEEGVAARFEELKNRQKKLEDFDESLNYRERYEMSALVKFGALGSKSMAEILEAYDYIKKLISGAENAQIDRLEKLEAEYAAKAAPFANALSKEENKSNVKSNKFTSGLEGSSMLEHRLRNLFVARKGLSEENRQKIEAWITDTNRDLTRASILERNWNEKESAWMRNIVRRIYADAFTDQIQNPIETQVVERLTKPDPKYRKYSVDGLDLSLGQVMQIVVSMEQSNVKQAYKQAKERMDKLQKSDKEIPRKFAEQFAVWEFRFKNQEAMRSELSAEDWELVSALKRRYRERFDEINPVYERYNGLPLISSGMNYMPLVRKGELDMESGGQSNSIYEFPDYYAPRTVSLKDIDEGANILALFQQRARTDAHFINFAGLIVELKTMFAEPDLASLVRTRLTPKERSELWSHLRDTLRGEIIRNTSSNDAIANTLSTITAYMGLGFNISSAFKQPTSFGAFALKVGFKRYVSNFIDLAASGQMLKVFNQIRKSEFLKDRRGEGINQIISELSREMNLVKDENSFKKGMRRFFVKYAFSPTKIADSWAFLGGASVYWEFYKNYREVHDDATAQRLAMIDMVGVGEMTQQSAFVMNMSESQRKDGGFGRMFTLFRTTNQQYLSFEVNAFKEFIANPNTETGGRLARIMVLNHIILPVLFNGAGLIANILLGDDMDEDDWEAFWANLGISMALDVFTGWWVTAILKGGAQAYFVGGKTDLASSVLPASALTRLASIAVSMGRDFEKNGFDADWQKQLDRMMKSLFAPYRLGKKVYDNATDDEKGVLW